MGLSLFEFYWLIVRNWKLVAACVAAFSIVGISVALLMKPVYRSEIVVARSNDDLGLSGLAAGGSGLGGLAALAGVNLNGAGGLGAEAMGLLRSKKLLQDLVERKKLMPVLFADRFLSNGQLKPGARPPTIEDAVLVLDRNIRDIREDAKTGLVVVRVDWTDRAAAADWATELVGIANEEMRRRAIAESDAALALLRQEWAKADSVSLRDALSRLIEGQLKSRTVASVRTQFAFKIVDAARVSDPDKRVRPARTLMAIFSAAAGFLFATLFLLFRRSLTSVHLRAAGNTQSIAG